MSLKNLAKQVIKQNKLANVSTEESLLQVLDAFLINKISSQKSSRKAFNPSSLYKCGRQVYYSLKDFPENKKVYPRSARILEVGTALHEWVQDHVFMEIAKDNGAIQMIPIEELPVYGKEGIEFIREHKSSPMEVKFIDRRYTEQIPISAMVDGAIQFQNKYYIFEFKTINPDDFAQLYEPLLDHRKQAAVYSMCLGITDVIFLYMCKGTQNWKPFIVPYNQDQYDWVVDRLKSLEIDLLSNTLPAPEVTKNCTFCGYKSLCEKDISEKG